MKKVFILSLLTLFAVSLMAQEARYEFKSAIIKSEMSFGEMKTVVTTYVDDYGKKEATEFSMVGPDGNESNWLNITEGATTTSVNLTAKTAFKMQSRQATVNFLKLTPEIKAARNIKELGEETVAEKSCKKYSLETSWGERTSKVTNWVWKGFVLKLETLGDDGNVFMSSKATEIQENVAVPAGKFVVPSGITVQEMGQ